MKELLISDDKKFVNDVLENLIFEWTISATEVKKVIKSICDWYFPRKKKKLRFNQELNKRNKQKKGRSNQENPRKSIKNA